MGFDFGTLTKGFVGAQASIPVTDLSPEVDGGQSATGAVRAFNSTEDETTILHYSAGIVIAAVALLWLMGSIAFRGLPTI